MMLDGMYDDESDPRDTSSREYLCIMWRKGYEGRWSSDPNLDEREIIRMISQSVKDKSINDVLLQRIFLLCLCTRVSFRKVKRYRLSACDKAIDFSTGAER